jgi:hypothetical protein
MGGVYSSGWRDLNSRPLDPQIGVAAARQPEMSGAVVVAPRSQLIR